MKKICLKVNMNIEDKKSKRRIMQCIAGIEGVGSVAVDTKERIITVIGDTDPVSHCRVLTKNGFSPELHSVGPAKEEKKVGWDTENRGRNPYLGMQRTEAVGGFGGVNRAIAYPVGSKTRIMEVLAGFGGMNLHYHNFVSAPKTVSVHIPCVCLLSCSGLLMLRLLCFRLDFNKRGPQRLYGNCGGKISSCECGTESEKNGVQSKAAEPRPCHIRTRMKRMRPCHRRRGYLGLPENFAESSNEARNYLASSNEARNYLNCLVGRSKVIGIKICPVTEKEDPDEEHNDDDDDPYPSYPNVLYADEDFNTPCTIA